MLSSDDRTLLVDLLAPPGAGFRLERAIGTTSPFTSRLSCPCLLVSPEPT